MLELFSNYTGILSFLVLLFIGYTVGTITERRHFNSLKRREHDVSQLKIMTVEEGFDYSAADSQLVMGSVVISIDYFKRLLALVKNLLGGRVSSYETLVERARREALLRMKAVAAAEGFDCIVNVRLETAAIGMRANQKGQIGSVETIAYGTALKLSERNG